MKPAASFSFEAIGTHWQIDASLSAETQQKVRAEIERYDKMYSRFRQDSIVTAISRAPGAYEFDATIVPLIKLYKAMYDATDGQVTPLIGQTLSDAGYDELYTLKSQQNISIPPDWDEAVMMLYGQNLRVKRPILLDFGAAGKGQLVDIIARILEALGVYKYCIDAGGDMRVRNSTKSLRVGLEDPDDSTKIIGIAEICNQSLCGSAGNRRKWAGYHHIINPKTLHSQNEVKATWVVADNTLLADGMATCLFFVPAQRLLQQFNFEYVTLFKDGSAEISAHFPGKLFE